MHLNAQHQNAELPVSLKNVDDLLNYKTTLAFHVVINDFSILNYYPLT